MLVVVFFEQCLHEFSIMKEEETNLKDVSELFLENTLAFPKLTFNTVHHEMIFLQRARELVDFCFSLRNY